MRSSPLTIVDPNNATKTNHSNLANIYAVIDHAKDGNLIIGNWDKLLLYILSDKPSVLQIRRRFLCGRDDLDWIYLCYNKV